ncbi:MAG: GGDEF domain-containing protein [Spirochaetes bacterium]|nr:GGDEF domain-containing protein [Spirochaetota bacterium]
MKHVKYIFLLMVYFWLSWGDTYANNRNYNILVLLTYHQSFPWTETFIEGLKRSREKYGKNLKYHIEILETLNLKNTLTDREQLYYLQKKYKHTKFDAVLAESSKASLFIEKYSSILAKDIPVIFYTANKIKCNSKKITFTADYNEAALRTLDLAIKQIPDIRNIYIITSNIEGYDIIIRNIRAQMMIRSEIKIHIIEDFSVQELLDRVKKIPEKSIIFYTLILEDRTGKRVVPRGLLSDVVKISKVPIYSFWSSLMGTGIVGGHMIDGVSTAEKMVEAAMDQINTGEFNKQYNILRSFFDGMAMEKFGIDKNTLPSDAVIINTPPRMIHLSYDNAVKAGIAIAFIIIAIFVFRSRKLMNLNRKLNELNMELNYAKENAEKLARIDNLTGLNNRLAFFEKGEQICREAKRLNKPASLLMLDIDNFKDINDKYGHPPGDLVIKRIADILNECKREADIAVRFGGEEFVIVAPFTELDGAGSLAERIRIKAENSIIEYGERQIRFTVSIGVYKTDPFICDLDLGIKLADDALYKAKANGKNRVVLWAEGI